MESIESGKYGLRNKNFSQAKRIRAVLQRLAQRNVYAITSFIFGMATTQSGL